MSRFLCIYIYISVCLSVYLTVGLSVCLAIDLSNLIISKLYNLIYILQCDLHNLIYIIQSNLICTALYYTVLYNTILNYLCYVYIAQSCTHRSSYIPYTCSIRTKLRVHVCVLYICSRTCTSMVLETYFRRNSLWFAQSVEQTSP